jgi:hypothetical protein
MNKDNHTMTRTTSLITDPTLYSNDSQQNGDRFCGFRRYNGAIRATIVPGFGDQNDKELEEIEATRAKICAFSRTRANLYSGNRRTIPT